MNGVETSVQIFQFLWTRSNISAKITESRIRALFKVPHGFVPGGPQELRHKRSRRKQQCPHQLTKLCLPLFASSHNGFDFYMPMQITISTIVLPNKINRAQCPTAVSQTIPKLSSKKCFRKWAAWPWTSYGSPASISLPLEWQQQNCFPRQPPGLQEVMHDKRPCSNARHTLGTKQKLISMLCKCWLESMPLKTSAMWKISISTWISKQRKLDDGSRLTLAQMKPSVRMQRVTGLCGAPSSGRRAGHRGAK